jgi:hypothetical protein
MVRSLELGVSLYYRRSEDGFTPGAKAQRKQKTGQAYFWAQLSCKNGGEKNVAAAGAYGCLPRVFRPPVIWLESTKT